MKQTRRAHLALLGGGIVAAAGLLPPVPARAMGGFHEVQMLNKHPDDPKLRMVFYPDIVRAAPGDTIHFVPTDRGHNSVCKAEGAPEGATLWKGKVGKEVLVTLDVEGAYTYFCQPHRMLGMAGLILVGDVSGNYDAIKAQKFPPKAQERYEDIFARADAMLAEEQGG